MLTVSIQTDILTEQNIVTMEPMEVSETDSFLYDSIHFNLGNWFEPTIQITKVSLDLDQLTKYENILQKYKTLEPLKSLVLQSERTSGSVILKLCLKKYLLPTSKIEDSLTLYNIPVQIGVLEQCSSDLKIFIRPRDIYESLYCRFNILCKINTNNKNSSINNEDFEIILKDYEASLGKISQIINHRIERVYKLD